MDYKLYNMQYTGELPAEENFLTGKICIGNTYVTFCTIWEDPKPLKEY